MTSREVSKKGDSMETFWGSYIMLFVFREPFHQAGDMSRDIRRIRGSEIKEPIVLEIIKKQRVSKERNFTDHFIGD